MSNTPDTERQQFAAKVAELGLEVEVEFVPWSRATTLACTRNATASDLSLTWDVKLKCHGAQLMTFRYTAGIGHAPGYAEFQKDRSVANFENLLAEAETGKMWALWRGHRARIKHIIPDTLDIIASIVQDTDALNYPTFENWANNFGYDPDSRKAEAIYQKCLGYGLRLRAYLGDATLEELRRLAHEL